MPYRVRSEPIEYSLRHPSPRLVWLVLGAGAIAIVCLFATQVSSVSVYCSSRPDGSVCIVDEQRFGIHSEQILSVARVTSIQADRSLFGRIILETTAGPVIASGRHPWLAGRFGTEPRSLGCRTRDGRGATRESPASASTVPAALLFLASVACSRRRAFLRLDEQQKLVVGHRTLGLEQVLAKWPAFRLKDLRVAPDRPGYVKIVGVFLDDTFETVSLAAEAGEAAAAVAGVRRAMMIDA